MAEARASLNVRTGTQKFEKFVQCTHVPHRGIKENQQCTIMHIVHMCCVFINSVHPDSVQLDSEKIPPLDIQCRRGELSAYASGGDQCSR